MARQGSHLRIVNSRDGAAVLDLHRGTISTLNGTGAIVWACLEKGDKVYDIVADLAANCDAPLEVVDRDVHNFLSTLKTHRLSPR